MLAERMEVTRFDCSDRIMEQPQPESKDAERCGHVFAITLLPQQHRSLARQDNTVLKCAPAEADEISRVRTWNVRRLKNSG